MMGFFKQAWTLTSKNCLIAGNRHLVSTIIRAFILPVAFMIFLAYARNLFVSPSVFGVGTPRPIRSLESGLAAADNGRNTVVFVNNGYAGGDIDRVIDLVAAPVLQAGKNVVRLPDSTNLTQVCRTSLRGVTSCYGAVVFTSSPTEGPGSHWNYSLRADGAFGNIIYVPRDNNDAQIYTLPLQRAVDNAIAGLSNTSLPTVLEYPFTAFTQEERAREIRVRFQQTLIDALAVAFTLGMVGVVYHLCGFVASEREIGMSQLIEAMMPNVKRWQPQVARVLSYHAAFTMIYLPGWLFIGIILSVGLFAKTSKAIIIIYHLLAGLSFTSWSIFGASFFRKAQLSGITVILITEVLGIIAQAFDKDLNSGGLIAALSLLFPSCNYTYFMVYIAQWELQELPANLTESAPNNWSFKGILFFIFLIIQIIVYPILGIFVERWLYGTTSKAWQMTRRTTNNEETLSTVELDGFSKHYPPNLWRRIFHHKSAAPVIAVNGLSLKAIRGQILVLLGANGSGKSTTLDAIAGMNAITSGTIKVDGTGGIGICPQKNVLWPELTVEEHIHIFNKLKSSKGYDSKDTIQELVKTVDLDRKVYAQSRTLSGGQKRKLQLGMMLTGGSQVCCVDEVSSGLDPLSRRKIWDILLAERGSRTIIFTTHFLDEADLLADHIVILSKGTLRAEGSSVELKSKLGGGYRVHLRPGRGHREAPAIDGISTLTQFGQTTYMAATSSEAALVVKALEGHGIDDYELSGPTIEDVFLQLAEEIRHESDTAVDRIGSSTSDIPSSTALDQGHSKENIAPTVTVASMGLKANKELNLLSGRPIGFAKQGVVLFRKRLTLLRRNFHPFVAVFLIPIICAILTARLVKDQTTPTCSPTTAPTATFQTIINQFPYNLTVGPPSKVPTTNATLYLASIFDAYPLTTLLALAGGAGGTSGSNSIPAPRLDVVDTLPNFNNYINMNHANVTPAGYYLGDEISSPTIAYRGDNRFFTAMFAQNILNSQLTNISITTQYRNFESPWIPGTGLSLQLVVYFGLVCAVVPAFFALYPTLERLRNVRGLEYSNGVRPAPLWIAYITFDWIIILVSMGIAVIIFSALSKVWFHIGYLFVVLMFYTLASTLLSYLVSLFAKGQLAAFAFSAGGQAIGFLLYLIAFLCVITYSAITRIDNNLLIVHYTMSLIFPMGSLVRALFVSMNLFSAACDGNELSSNPGSMNQFGAPILYLALQAVAFFGFLLWHDSDSLIARFKASRQTLPAEGSTDLDEETVGELEKVSQDSAGLRVLHLTKAFGKNTAVENLTFGIQPGEVFALLGPNGAGKSTTISLIRGDIQPSKNGGNIYVDDILISKHRAQARAHLGVCPQFDAMDQLTVLEHLAFYARIRGISDVSHNVQAVIHAVGLSSFASFQAMSLSGGNKRKLSLGIALMGNPSVVLLDEPSSGMDAAAKRVMWKTLSGVVAGRAILLTTHSMEEAAALASRAGIMARRMLAMGTTDYLRKKHGDALHVHLVTKTAPHTSEEEMARLKQWVVDQFPGSEVEEKTYHGQLRFSVPVGDLSPTPASVAEEHSDVNGDVIDGGREPVRKAGASSGNGGIGALIMLLEEKKEELGLEYYSVSPTTLDQVFLSIVGKHNVEEENYKAEEKAKWWEWPKKTRN